MVSYKVEILQDFPSHSPRIQTNKRPSTRHATPRHATSAYIMTVTYYNLNKVSQTVKQNHSLLYMYL